MKIDQFIISHINCNAHNTEADTLNIFQIKIPDTLEVNLSNDGRLELIELNVLIRNTSVKKNIIFEPFGVKEIGSITGEFDSSFCSNISFGGGSSIKVKQDEGAKRKIM